MNRSNSAEIVALLCEKNQLLLICSHLLDMDIQPEPEDFSVLLADQSVEILGATLLSPMQPGSTWSVITLELDQALPLQHTVTLEYHPVHYFLWSEDDDDAIEPFRYTGPLREKQAISGFELPVQQEDAPAVSDPQPPSTIAPLAYKAPRALVSKRSKNQTPKVANRQETLKPAVKTNPASSHTTEEVVSRSPVKKVSNDSLQQSIDQVTAMDTNISSLQGDVSGTGETSVVDSTISVNTDAEENTGLPVWLTRTLLTGSALVALWGVVVVIYMWIFISEQGEPGAVVHSEPAATAAAPVATASQASWVKKPCKLTKSDGWVYHGECVDGRGQGQGSIQWPNGARYQGAVEESKPNGYGTLRFPNGDVYTGEFRDGRKHGRGTMAWSSGARYEGDYENGKYHGRGIYWMVSGARFEGVFSEGNFTHQGICILPEGERIQGACPRRFTSS